MRNRFTEVFGLRYPLCSAGMAMIATPPLVAAVSAAGALGILGTGPAPTQWIAEAIHDIRRRTAAPFGVNLIHETTAFGPMCTDEHIRLCIDEAVGLVVFFWQCPPRDWVAALQNAGIPVWATMHSADDIDAALGLGIDGLMVQGREAGGHMKSTAPLADLVGAARRRCPDMMLIGAGGIATGADVRRVLGLGADGVCLGTRFVAAEEADAHPDYQARILAADADDTVVTTRFGPEWPGVPMRVLRNAAAVGATRRGAIGRTTLFGSDYELPACSAVLPTRATRGDPGLMCLAAGESVRSIDTVKPAGEIVHGLFDSWWPGGESTA